MANQSTTLERTEAATRSNESSAPSLRSSSPEVSDVAELCQQKLSRSPYIALRYLICHFHEGMLTVRGTVPTFYTKQMAYITIRDVPGVERIVDQVEVVASDYTSDA